MTAATSRTAPVHATGARLVQTPGERAFLTRRGDKTRHELNDTALALWELCDGETTVAEMVGAVVQLFDTEPALVETDITLTLGHLADAGLLTWNDGPPPTAHRYPDPPSSGASP